MSPQEILSKYWGYPAFRPLQEDIIQSVMSGRDTLALLPTGGGKSICFQVPALAMDGLCLVISPLIALMKDQVYQLKKRGIAAAAIYSGMTAREIDFTLDNCIYGNLKFLYLSPERLKTPLFLERLKKMKVALLAIDEAHCISQWGYDFRPPYLEIAAIKEHIPQAKLIALTATATREVKEDIVAKLEMKEPAIFKKSFARKNLSYSAFALEGPHEKLLEILRKVGGSSIVYVRSRKRTQEVAATLRAHGISAEFYHAGLDNAERSRRQDAWIHNKIRVMVATNAFGMGIDKPDVRTVIHLDIPESLEAYYQEAGRAGRDEKMAFAVALFHKKDTLALMERAESSVVTVEEMQRVYQALANHYKIAVGSHQFESLPFHLSDFCKAYTITPVVGLQALRQLEEAGILQVSDSVYQEAKLHMLLSKEELYRFEVANAKFDVLIKAILRLYGGEIFLNYVSIKEGDIARLAKLPVEQVTQQLRYLSEQGIWDYKPATDTPTVTLLMPRMLPVNLPIDRAFIAFKRNTAMKKAQAMVNYLETATKCRTRQLQAYFDEKTDENCGVCDFCLNKKKTRADIPINEVLTEIKKGATQLSILGDRLPKHKHELIVEAVRMLIEDNKVRLENDRLHLPEKLV